MVQIWRKREEADPDLSLVVGLGNPGKRFERTRHNIGFMVVNRLAQRAEVSFAGSKLQADIARGTIDGLPVLLAQPLTFMNESGRAVSRLVQYYQVPLDRLLVIADDLDLPFGTLRLRASGSSGGQRGLESIIEALGTHDFARLRIGISRPGSNAIDHVLSAFPPEQERLVPRLTDFAADATLAALRDIPAAMNEYNRDWLPVLASDSCD